LPIAAASGLFLGIFLCYVKDYFDPTIQNERDIHEVLKLPLLAVLPHAKGFTLRGKASVEKAPLLAPQLPYVEFLQRLANIVQFAGNKEGLKTLLICSACPREGRTSLTANLGIALANRNQRVLVIDGDLRNPSLQGVFSLDSGTGLTDILESGSDPIAYCLETEVTNLSCLPAGPCPQNPTILLESAQAKDSIQALKEKFDWILIDSSALLEVPDTTSLARSADAVLWVIASGETSK
jgi:capsular exopolysaccharide synthesis family protein